MSLEVEITNYAEQVRLVLASEEIPREETLVKLLIKASDDYHNNDGESEITDAQYDALYLLLQNAYPSSLHLTVIGSEVRGGKATSYPRIYGSSLYWAS
jgi:hypothetical protein